MLRVAIITSSDTGYEGIREDISGRKIEQMVLEKGYEVVSKVILPDEKELLKQEMIRICDGDFAELIITTGGTGLSARDCMPEATTEVAHRMVPGIGEAMRSYSMQFTKRAMLSRGVSVVRGQTLIVNLPGSPKAVEECLTYVMDDMEHGIKILRGMDGNCARK